MTGRIPITEVTPVVACGRHPAKCVVGESVPVSATVFREGHDAVAATLVLIDPEGVERERAHMRAGQPGTDAWHGQLRPDRVGHWSFQVEGWGDPFGTWEHVAEVKIPAEQDVELTLTEGALLFDRALGHVPPTDSAAHEVLRAAESALRDTSRPAPARLAAALDHRVADVLATYPVREHVTVEGPFPLQVERERALFGSWYELFPRSEGAIRHDDGSWTSGTFITAARRLPAVAEMGFDVVYLPPIHPIGHTHRKGPNNTLTPGPEDPGVPWAIGSAEGGHDAVHPGLGTIDDFDDFVAAAGRLGLEVALDLALQASPDHPWVSEHPEWFTTRADGTIAYAENPPKKYQDIYPLNFDNDPEGLYRESERIVRYWMDHGVRIFRVDNPHTKPVSFWQRLIGSINRTDPDVIFLAEAFTRPPMMHTLARIGFQQSYTYFTWRTSVEELTEYFTELRDSAAYMRPNAFVNTPDILHAFLQYGGPAAFAIRAVLAATLSPTWGVYTGYELFEHVALRPGSEEYLDSEKYQFRPRDWAAYEPGGAKEDETLAPFLTRLNELRRRHPALQRLRSLRFHPVDNPSLMCFSKREPIPGSTGGNAAPDEDEDEDVVIVVVTVDPHAAVEGTVHLNMPDLGLGWHDVFDAHDELSGQTFGWNAHNYVRLDPTEQCAHLLHVRPRPTSLGVV